MFCCGSRHRVFARGGQADQREGGSVHSMCSQHMFTHRLTTHVCVCVCVCVGGWVCVCVWVGGWVDETAGRCTARAASHITVCVHVDGAPTTVELHEDNEQVERAVPPPCV